MPSAEPLLICDGLSYSYLERFTALDDVTFDVARGETLALLGANGCGKSTLLKVLDGLLFPDAGHYRAFGHPVTEDLLEDEQFSTAFRSRVGFIFQNTDAQVFSPSVREEVAFGPLQLGIGRDEVEQRDRRRDGDARDRRPRRPRAVPALRRPEEARRDRLGARHQPRADPVRRADRGARSAHAAVAARADRRARPRRQDDRAGDARPGRARLGLRPLPGVLRGAPDRQRRHARGGARRPRHAAGREPDPPARAPPRPARARASARRRSLGDRSRRASARGVAGSIRSSDDPR